MRVLDLSQDFSMHTPAFASYTGPSIKWVKRLAFDKAGGQEITTTLHVSTHLDAPAHFLSGGKFIGELPLQWLVGTACGAPTGRGANAGCAKPRIADRSICTLAPPPIPASSSERATSMQPPRSSRLVIVAGRRSHGSRLFVFARNP